MIWIIQILSVKSEYYPSGRRDQNMYGVTRFTKSTWILPPTFFPAYYREDFLVRIVIRLRPVHCLWNMYARTCDQPVVTCGASLEQQFSTHTKRLIFLFCCVINEICINEYWSRRANCAPLNHLKHWPSLPYFRGGSSVRCFTFTLPFVCSSKDGKTMEEGVMRAKNGIWWPWWWGIGGQVTSQPVVSRYLLFYLACATTSSLLGEHPAAAIALSAAATRGHWPIIHCLH